LWRICEAARGCGYLEDLPEFLSDHDAGYLPRDKVVLVCTGSQGEPRSALARIAAGDHPQIDLEPGDVVVFSSREIPGNEKAIALVQNRLIGQGVRVLTADDYPVHVSGHPAQDEVTRMLQWVRPRTLVPVHGERRHQEAHADLGRACQVPEIVIPTNGTLVRLAPGPAAIIDHVPTGRLALDGTRLVRLDSGALRSRHRVIWNGAVVVTLVLNQKGELVGAPRLTVLGLVDEEGEHDRLLDLTDLVREAVAALPKLSRREDEPVVKAVRSAVRRSFQASHGKKPQTDVHLVRV
jgi:ribonuclease J